MQRDIILNLSVVEINLSVRAANALRRRQIFTVRELLALTEEQLFQINNLGRKSVEEIMAKINEISTIIRSAAIDISAEQVDPVTHYDEWLAAKENQQRVIAYLESAQVDLKELDLLPAKPYNLLTFAGYTQLHQVIFLSADELRSIPLMDNAMLWEIRHNCKTYLQENKDAILAGIRFEPVPQAENTEATPSAPDSGESAYDLPLAQMKLSVRSFNALSNAGYRYLSELVSLQREDLLRIRNLGAGSADEILEKVQKFHIPSNTSTPELSTVPADTAMSEWIRHLSIFSLMELPAAQQKILSYVQANDQDFFELGLSVRAHNALRRAGYRLLSELLFMKQADLFNIANLGRQSIEEIIAKRNDYLIRLEPRILAFIASDGRSLLDVDTVRKQILSVYLQIGFKGLRFSELLEKIDISDAEDIATAKKAVGQLLADGELVYTDALLYRIYPTFASCNDRYDDGSDRNIQMLRKRMQGATLEEIAQQEGITRERVRQIIKKVIARLRTSLLQDGHNRFDEDYYSHLYTNYAVDKTICTQWLGIPYDTYRYLKLIYSAGTQPLEKALEDPELDICMKLRIRNYWNRNAIFVDGVRLEKKRSALEVYVLQKYCKKETSFDEYCEIYNNFLVSQNIPFSPDLYYTEENAGSRLNRFSLSSRHVLWKQNRMLRYYDIDARDYTALLHKLSLHLYKNTEISTVKFMEAFPRVMVRYDIRDQYELHNLLRKIVPVGEYNDFHCERMPIIRFGKFNAEEAFLELLIQYAPISQKDLVDLIHEEYGYEKSTIASNYLQGFNQYLHQGIYTIDAKEMPQEHKALLKAALTEDFYFFWEIKRIYASLVPNADLELINPYNLKNMGLTVLSKYVLQNWPTLSDYFKHLLDTDVVDLAQLKKRFSQLNMWNQTLFALRHDYEILEFEPGQAIPFRKLAQAGVTKNMLRSFCDEVYAYLKPGTYFTIRSLDRSGFTAELYDLGFSEWFYSNLILNDPRFSYYKTFGTIILYKGENQILNNQTFIVDQIRLVQKIDLLDLVDHLKNTFGYTGVNTGVVKASIRDTEIFYDPILDRLYADIELYYRELDEDTEDF